jgi:tetratricopeptide (TPR) repeat protein
MELKLKPDKIESLEYLISRVFEKDQTGKPKFCFLLGAGCSAYSGIPLGWGVIERCRTIVFLNHHLQGSKVKNMAYPTWRDYYQAAEKFREERKDEYEKFVAESEKKFRTNLTEKDIRDIIPDELENSHDFDYPAYSEKVINDRLYGFWLDKYDEDPRERQMFIEHIIEDIEPAGDYILFSSLVDGQVIHNVFTTNFDDLLNEALVNYYNNRARVYAHNEMARYISPVSKRPNIIKLHGDYLYENIKNTNLETGDLEANMKTKFSEMLNQMNLVVVGYGGADHSVMSVLELVKKDTKYCLIWCGIDPDKLNWRVVHLLNSTKNSFFVQVTDFQTLVLKLWTNADLKLPDLESDLKVKKSRLEDFLTKYKDQVKDRDEVTKKEMDILVDRTEALKWFNRGYEEKDFNKQIDYYSKAIEFNPKDHLAFYNRAFSYGELKQYDKAIEDLNIALQIDPTYTNAYINRGLAFNNLKQYDQAIEDYSKAIDLDPNSVLAYGNRSSVYYDLNQYDKVIEDCNKAIELDPNYSNGYINRGLAFSSMKQYDKALWDYDKAIERTTNPSLAYSNRGLLYINTLKFDKAIADFNKAIENDPLFTNAYINRGLAFYNLKQFDDAIKDYTKAIELDQNYALAYGNRSLVYYDSMLYQKAIEDCNKAIELDPNYSSSYINRGLAYSNLKEYDKALKDYDRAIELNPENALGYSNRGWLYYENLQYEKAIEDYCKTIELEPENANAFINRGNNYYGLMKYEKAIEDYTMAIKIQNDSLAFANRGTAYSELKKYKESVADFQKSIELNPDYLLAYQNLTEVNIFTGQYSEAEKVVDIALKKANAIEDKTFLQYMKLIACAMCGKDYKAATKNLEELLHGEYTTTWNLTQIGDWIAVTDMPVEIRKALQSMTKEMNEKIAK